MEFEIWHYWILATIVFFILEIFIPSFLMASIGIGCIAAFFGAATSAPFTIQMVLFILGTTGGFVSVKPVMKRFAYRDKTIHTNALGLVGRIGKVKEEINEEKGTGCVAIDGDLWTSIPTNNQVIKAGEKVRVVELNSIILTVEPLEDDHPHSHPDVELPQKKEKERFTIRVGNRTFFVGYSETAFLYSSEKITHLVTTEGKQYIYDRSLDRVFPELPDEMFFRANRQFIVTRNVVREIKTAANGKIKVYLNTTDRFPHRIIVSRLKAAAFREWINKNKN